MFWNCKINHEINLYVLNVIWHIISDPRDIDFFSYVKKRKIWKIQDAQKCWPWAEFGIWQDESSNFHGRIRFWAFLHAKLTGKDICTTPPAAPPIIISEISEKSEMIIGGATGGVMKMAFPVNLESWKAQNLIVP